MEIGAIVGKSSMVNFFSQSNGNLGKLSGKKLETLLRLAYLHVPPLKF